jgi:hypothetical protein
MSRPARRFAGVLRWRALGVLALVVAILGGTLSYALRPDTDLTTALAPAADRATAAASTAESPAAQLRHVHESMDIDDGEQLGPWRLVRWTTLPTGIAGQGVATVLNPNGTSRIVTRGLGSIPLALRRAGWTHIGDPDSIDGYLLDAYQSAVQAGVHTATHPSTKLFTLTSPAGVRTDYLHRLVRGEMFNNSFVAIAPGGRWFVSGEWLTVKRLLVFALPRLLPLPQVDSNLALASTIRLKHPVRDVQGCAFTGATTLLCSTNDPRRDLFPVPHQLLRIQLAHPLDGTPDSATVHLLGELPQRSSCPGLGEVEGLDVAGSRLLVAVIEPGRCSHSTQLYTYVDNPAGGTPS